MGHLLNMGIKMQSVVTTTTTTSTSTSTTTTTTTSATKTVNYYGDTGGCVGSTVRFIKNGVTQCVSGSSCFGSFTVVAGDTITAEHSSGPKATGLCQDVFACIGSTDGGCEYGSDSNAGVGVTASVTITITSAYPSVIYMNAGLAI